MTDEQIIKAWEKYVYPTDSIGQKLYPVVVKCPRELAEQAFDLINRIEEQNAALIAGQKTLQKHIAEKDAEIKQKDEKIKRLKSFLKLVGKSRFAIAERAVKAEAIKEFAERLKEKAERYDDEEFYVNDEDIDNLVKEMVGDESCREK